MAVGFPTAVPHCPFPFPCIPNVCMHFRVSYYSMLLLSGTLSCGVLNSKTNTEVDPVSGDCLVSSMKHFFTLTLALHSDEIFDYLQSLFIT